MARKEEFITLKDGDTERLFRIRQMSAVQQERWSNRFLHLLGKSGINEKELGEDFDFARIIAALPPDEFQPLWDELLTCCAHIPDPNNRGFATELSVDNADAIIEDFRTLYALRGAVFKLCFGFFGEVSPTETKPEIRISKNTPTRAL